MRLRSWLVTAGALGAALTAAASASAATGTAATPGRAVAVYRGGGPGPRAPRVHGLRLAPGVHLPRTRPPHLGPRMTVYSNNWGGHAATANPNITLRSVSAAFNVPSINCASSPPGASGYAYVGHWAGLDGYSSSTVEQAGVAGFCTSTTGAPSYYAWYEMYPLNPVTFTGINPGDAITVSVGYLSSGADYSIVLRDLTTGGNFTAAEPCPSGSTCPRSSAEVITEDPGGAVAGGYNLADFGQENYTGATVISMNGTVGTLNSGVGGSGTSLWGGHNIEMVDPGGAMMASTGPLYGGQAFNITWDQGS